MMPFTAFRHAAGASHCGVPALLAFLLVMPMPTAAHAQATAASSAQRIDVIVDAAPLDRAHWGIHAVDAASGEVVYSRNADELFVPASGLKLVVASAGAHYLGADYQWRTEVRATGSVRGGVLDGDLVVRGSGDPGISGRFVDGGMLTVLELWADSLRARGVQRITGGIIADQTMWDAQLRSTDWELYDANWWYAAAVAPVGFNDNAIDFRVAPGEPGGPARITWQPRTGDFVFVNRTRTISAGGEYTLDFNRIAGTDTIFAYGALPVDADTRTESFAVADPGRYLTTVFTEVLATRGIDVGTTRGRSVYGTLPGVPAEAVATTPAGPPFPGSTLLFTWTSAPLPVTIAPILLTSQNWFAGQLLKTIAYETSGIGSFAEGLEAEARFLTDVVGIDSAAFVLRDASGLAAANLITPRAMTRLLQYLERSGLHDILEPGISVAGATGSLRNRLTDLEGRVRAKTGSIRYVASLSGTVRTDSGRDVVFSIIANKTGLPGTPVARAIDDVVRALSDH